MIYCDTLGSKGFVSICKMKFSEYKKIKDFFPMIMTDDFYFVEYSERSDFGYDFMPARENADNEDLYLKCRDEDIVNVFVGFEDIPAFENNKNIIEKINKVQKTYLMFDGDGYIKIGKSYNPEIREKTLMSTRPSISLLAYSDNDVEDELHEEYAEKNKRGEWFSLSLNDVKDIIKKYNMKKVESYYSLMIELRKIWSLKYNPIKSIKQ